MRELMALLKKERLLMQRDKRGMISVFFFTALVVLMLYFGLGYFEVSAASVVPNVIWLATIFGATLQLNRTFDYEREESVMEGLKIIKGIAGKIYISKFLVNVAIVLMVSLFAAAFALMLFNYAGSFNFIWSIALGAVCISAVGTTFSSMFMSHHKKDVMLPTLFYPLITPIVLAVIKAADPETLDAAPWLRIIFVFSISYITISYLVFDSILED